MWEASRVQDWDALEVTGQELGKGDGQQKAIETQIFDRHLMLGQPDFVMVKTEECTVSWLLPGLASEQLYACA